MAVFFLLQINPIFESPALIKSIESLFVLSSEYLALSSEETQALVGKQSSQSIYVVSETSLELYFG